jgi:hypothetical protein
MSGNCNDRKNADLSLFGLRGQCGRIGNAQQRHFNFSDYSVRQCAEPESMPVNPLSSKRHATATACPVSRDRSTVSARVTMPVL